MQAGKLPQGKPTRYLRSSGMTDYAANPGMGTLCVIGSYTALAAVDHGCFFTST